MNVFIMEKSLNVTPKFMQPTEDKNFVLEEKEQELYSKFIDQLNKIQTMFRRYNHT